MTRPDAGQDVAKPMPGDLGAMTGEQERAAVWKGPLSPACMKCEQVTGNSTCFPGPCVFYRERGTPGTVAHNVATLDRIRRGMREPVRVSTTPDTTP